MQQRSRGEKEQYFEEEEEERDSMDNNNSYKSRGKMRKAGENSNSYPSIEARIEHT